MVHNNCFKKPNQDHHIATNKSDEWTPVFEEIAGKYGLDLDDDWNIVSLPHQGRHPWEYHSLVEDAMNYADNVAAGNVKVFKDIWSEFAEFLKDNPDMLYSNFWRK